MPIAVLAPMVVIGVALVVGACWALGWSEPVTLDAATARDRFLVDHPEARIDEVAVGSDGASALLWLGTEAAVVFAVGDRCATRLVRRARVEAAPGALTLHFPDLATPPVRVAVDDPVWRERLGA